MKDLTQGNIYKNFILFAIPLVFAGILSQGYHIIDTVIAGKYLGDSGLAATGATAEFITFASSILWGYSGGLGIYTARLFGAKDYKTLKTAIYNNLIFVILIATVIGMISIVFGDVILDLLKVDSAVHENTKVYMTVYFVGFAFILLNTTFVHILNSLGISAYTFTMSLVSAVMNIAGNIFTVTVLDMGVAGIALSSVISAAVVDMLYMIKLKKSFKEMSVNKYRVKYGFLTLKNSFVYSVTVMIQQTVMYTSSLLISPIVNGIGMAATASFTVINRVYNINAGIYQNSAKTVGNYIAQSVGAKKPENIKKGVRVGALQGFILMMPVILACIIFAKPVSSVFFPSGFEGDALTYSVDFIKICLPFLFFNMLNNLFHHFFRGTGCMRLLLLSTFIGSASRLIFTVILANKYGMNGFFAGWILSWITEALFSLIVYKSGVWKREMLS